MRLLEAELIVLALVYLMAAVPVAGIVLGRPRLSRLPSADVGHLPLVVAMRAPARDLADRLDGDDVDLGPQEPRS